MFLQQLINGITIGSTYALVAIGYSMVFGVLELINFAHGSVYMLGGYFTLMIYAAMNGHFFLAFALSIVLSGVVGYSIDALALKTLRRRHAPKLSSLMATLGVGTIIDNCVLLFFGSETKPYPNMLDFGQFEIGGTIVTWLQIIILIAALVLMAATSLLVYKTKIGRYMLATAQNADATRLMGINVSAVISFTFIIGSMLAAVAGTLIGMYYQSIDSTMGFSIGMKTFAAAVLGGVGVLPGAMVGGLAIGIIETIAASYIHSGYRDAIAFGILILVLLVKPSGLFGKKQITKV